MSPFRYIRLRKYLERVTLTAEGFAYLTVVSFITIGSVLRNVNLLILMTGIMFAPLLINWRLAVHRVRSLRGRRQLPSRMYANQMASVQWHCENSQGSVPAMNVIAKDRIRRAPAEAQTLDQDSQTLAFKESRAGHRLFGELRDRLFRGADDRSTAVSQVRFQRLMVGQTDIQSFRVYFRQRGKYWIGPAEINCSFPFGLIVSRQGIGAKRSVMVGPELGVLSPSWEKRMNSTAKGNDAVRRSRAIEEDDFFALRRWRAGDSLKNIHWRSTAKQRFPIVKQFVERNNRDFALVLDLFADDDQPQTLQDCESALSFAATTLLSVNAVVEGQAAIAVCGKTLDFFRSKTVGGIVAETMPALAVAAGHSTPSIVEGVVSCLDAVSSGTPVYVVSSREMPVNLESGLQLETESSLAESSLTGSEQAPDADRVQRARYVARRMRSGIQMVRWLNVQSDDFKEIFSLDKQSDHSTDEDQTLAGRKQMPADLAEVSQKWISHAKR